MSNILTQPPRSTDMALDQTASSHLGEWSQIDLAGHPCPLYEPHEPNEHGYTVLYLHGRYQGTPADRAQMMEHFANHGLRIIAPLSRRSWWADRLCLDFDPHITPEKYLLQKVLPYMHQRWQCEPPRIALMGASMGGQGALRLAYKYPDLFPVVAAISPAIDFQSCIAQGDELLRSMYRDEEDARQDTATLHVHALNWPRHQFFCCDPTDYRWFDSSDRLHMKLSALGIPHEFDLETSHGGHGCTYYHAMASRAIEFIAQSLERERMRIV